MPVSKTPFTKPHNFKQLAANYPELQAFLIYNKKQQLSIDFFNPQAVKVFNRVLLNEHYGIEYWDFPDKFLCPPIPGRADYLQKVYSLLKDTKQSSKQSTTPIRVLDIGVGANCIYPLIGHQAYNWQFIGSDCNETAVKSARNIVTRNGLENQIQIRHQQDPNQIFTGIIQREEYFDLTICNPPFYATEEEATAATKKRLKYKDSTGTVSSFAGRSNELWRIGGELQFITQLIKESALYGNHCSWFTVLVSKGGNLDRLARLLENKGAIWRVFPLKRGNKVRRILSWHYPKEFRTMNDE